jgi:heme/copper-type cytochrome/quinol oxidase subunit 2
MKKASVTTLIVGIVCSAYGYWGSMTRSGSKMYDEMDAMLPFFVLVFGVFLLIVFLVLLLLMNRSSNMRKHDKPRD